MVSEESLDQDEMLCQNCEKQFFSQEFDNSFIAQCRLFCYYNLIQLIHCSIQYIIYLIVDCIIHLLSDMLAGFCTIQC